MSERQIPILYRVSTAVHDGMFNNPAFPTPPVDMTTFKSAIDTFSASVAAALDGGKSVTALKNKRRGEVILMLRQLGHYVEVACKGDLATFTSSGFVPVSSVRAADQPTDTPDIDSISSGWHRAACGDDQACRRKPGSTNCDPQWSPLQERTSTGIR